MVVYLTIVFSDHARAQIKRRGISTKLVLKAVRNSDELEKSFRNRKLRRIASGDKILEVVTRTEGPNITVVTAYYLKK